LLIAICPSACTECCLTISRSVEGDFTAWGRRAVTFGGATIEWKDGIVLSFLQAGARACLSHRRPSGGSLAGDRPPCASIEQLASLFQAPAAIAGLSGFSCDRDL
jgi:hypothetical protein